MQQSKVSTKLSLAEYHQLEEETQQRYEYAVQTYYRASNTDLWQITWIEGLESFVPLKSLGLEVPMQELYLKTENL